jgi:hypothetical protein
MATAFGLKSLRHVKLQIIVANILSAATFDASMGQNNPSDPAMKNYEMVRMDPVKLKNWQSKWERYIISDSKNRYCDKEMGEEIGWLISPFLSGFYYGYLATDDAKWPGMLVDWTDAWIKRAVTEPDGYIGWPKFGAAGTSIDNLDDFYADSLLGEAMAMRPVVLMSKQILAVPALEKLYGAKAEGYIKLSQKIFEKWDRRGAWRDTEGGGMITVVLPFGIDQKNWKWTDEYSTRNASRNGFSHQNNKANLVASWLLSMFDVTGELIYKERAEKWFRLMKSRMKIKNNGTYQIWNYWQPAGAWDYKYFVVPKHWIGVHRNADYYSVDVDSIVTAYEHGLIFSREDISRLIATSVAENRYWSALVRYNAAIQMRFEGIHKPDSWFGLTATPWYLTLQSQAPGG